MNCIDKMYKEIEEILNKEKQEYERLQVPVKEIKNGFSTFSDNDEIEEVAVQVEKIDYLSKISYDEKTAQKKYFNDEKAKSFVEYIFKKYCVLAGIDYQNEDFSKEVEEELKTSENLIESLLNLENKFAKEYQEYEVEDFFVNPYNALFKDEKGYYAVILNGKFSDLKRPESFNPNQLKKLIKEQITEYSEDFSKYFPSEKVKNAFLNNIKADINKVSDNELISLQTVVEDKLYTQFLEKQLSKEDYESYLNEKGLRLVKQGNYYFRKNASEVYNAYKKIEFRY